MSGEISAEDMFRKAHDTWLAAYTTWTLLGRPEWDQQRQANDPAFYSVIEAVEELNTAVRMSVKFGGRGPVRLDEHRGGFTSLEGYLHSSANAAALILGEPMPLPRNHNDFDDDCGAGWRSSIITDLTTPQPDVPPPPPARPSVTLAPQSVSVLRGTNQSGRP